MRALFVCADPGVPVFGRKGCSVHVQELLRALRRAGVRSTVRAARVDGKAPADLADLDVRALPWPRLPPGEPEPDVVESANEAARAALESAGEADFVYERHSLWSWAGMEHARRRGWPGLLEVNAPLVEEAALHRGLRSRASAEAAAGRVFAAASTVLPVSAELAGRLETAGVARSRIHVVPNGVDPDRFRPGLPPSRPSPPGVFTVGFVGTLKPWHGLPVLLDAFARLYAAGGNARLLLVGDGPERAAVLNDLHSRGLEHVAELTGAVAPEEVPRLLASFDAAVVPYSDGASCYFSPLKLYEYMAAGLPVVASDAGQVREVIRHEVSGLLCPPGDAAALARELDRLRASAPLRARLGAAARTTVLARHTWAATAGRVLALAARPLACVTGGSA